MLKCRLAANQIRHSLPIKNGSPDRDTGIPERRAKRWPVRLLNFFISPLASSRRVQQRQPRGAKPHRAVANSYVPSPAPPILIFSYICLAHNERNGQQSFSTARRDLAGTSHARWAHLLLQPHHESHTMDQAGGNDDCCRGAYIYDARPVYLS